MQEAVAKIKKIGAPPEGFEDSGAFPPEEVLDLWEEYENAVLTIQTPVTWEEAEILIECCPVERMAGIEWSLLHCIESCSGRAGLETPDGLEKYRKLIGRCNSAMMKALLSERLESYLSKQG